MLRQFTRAVLLQVAVGAAMVMVLGAGAKGQIEPDRTYYGVERGVPVSVQRPAEAEGEAEIWLLNTENEQLAAASVIEGRVDLAGVFSSFWADEPQLRYAQLVIAGEKVGPAVVLQPLLTPPLAYLSGPGGEISWREAKPEDVVYSGVRAYVDKLVVLETSEGDITIRLRPDQAPNTVWSFRSLVEGGFYTDIPFHRVVPTSRSGEPFVAQAGDPTGSGMGGPGFYIDLEQSRLPHNFGVLSMARGPDPNSNGSQFFLGLSRAATGHLDGLYTAFGEAVDGASAIVTIAETPLLEGSEGHRPVEPPRILEARLIDAPPRGEGPEPVTRPEPAPIDR